MLQPGFMGSSLAITSTPGWGKSRFTLISGVLPTHAGTESYTDSMAVSATVTQWTPSLTCVLLAQPHLT